MYLGMEPVCFFLLLFYFFKQKTAYEMRSSDWRSDVCSSDLIEQVADRRPIEHERDRRADRAAGAIRLRERIERVRLRDDRRFRFGLAGEIGRESCQERVCQYV